MKKEIRKKDEGNFIKRYWNSLCHALDGINYTIEKEKNMLGIMIFSILVLVLAILLPISLVEAIIVVLVVGLMIIFELVNTSIEAVVDLVTTKNNELAKIAKDTASSAEFIMIVVAVLINLIIFIPKILEMF